MGFVNTRDDAGKSGRAAGGGAKAIFRMLLWCFAPMVLQGAVFLENPANRDFVVKDGNLLRRPNGQAVATPVSQATSCGCVTGFDVDGGQVAVIQSAQGEKTAALVTIDLATGRVLAEIRAPFFVPDRGEGRYFAGAVRKIVFDASHSRAYLLLIDGATAWTLLRVDVSSRTTAWIHSAVDMHLVRAGKYRSHLVVLLNRLKLSPGRFLAYYLIDGDGKEVGLIGTEEGDVGSFALLYDAIP